MTKSVSSNSRGCCSAEKERLLPAGAACPELFRLIGCVLMPGIGVSILELHFLDILIRADDLVAHLHHQLERDVRFLDGDHHVVHVAAAALQQVADLRGCIVVAAESTLFTAFDRTDAKTIACCAGFAAQSSAEVRGPENWESRQMLRCSSSLSLAYEDFKMSIDCWIICLAALTAEAFN